MNKGHFREQPCGPGGRQRKTIYVQPRDATSDPRVEDALSEQRTALRVACKRLKQEADAMLAELDSGDVISGTLAHKVLTGASELAVVLPSADAARRAIVQIDGIQRLATRREADAALSHYLTNEIAVDAEREVTLTDNGETGDAKVSLRCAPATRGAGGWLYYLTTNGDPVLLTEEDGVEWIETSGLTEEQIREAIDDSPADAESKDWALDTVGGAIEKGKV
jgi:hypothetical protein